MELIAYNIQAACAALGIGRTHAYALVAEGHLEARKIGRRTVISAASVRRYFDSLPPAPLKAKGARYSGDQAPLAKGIGPVDPTCLLASGGDRGSASTIGAQTVSVKNRLGTALHDRGHKS